MTLHNDAAYQYAKEELSKLMMSASWDWNGPVAYILMQELLISMGPYQLDYDAMGISDVAHGYNMALPLSSVKPLINYAVRHPEAFGLARHVAADLIDGGEPLPSEIQLFAITVLRGDHPKPKKPKRGKDLPKTANFYRNHAIYWTLRGLKERFDVLPTQNLAKAPSQDGSLSSGSKIILAALSELEASQKRSNININLETGSVNSIWSNRRQFENLRENAFEELSQCKSVFQLKT